MVMVLGLYEVRHVRTKAITEAIPGMPSAGGGLQANGTGCSESQFAGPFPSYGKGLVRPGGFWAKDAFRREHFGSRAGDDVTKANPTARGPDRRRQCAAEVVRDQSRGGRRLCRT